MSHADIEDDQQHLKMQRSYVNLNLKMSVANKRQSKATKIKRMHSIRQLKKQQPDSWLLQKIIDPKEGQIFFRRCSVAAETIQKRWRAQKLGREAREKFRTMLQNKNALFNMLVYLCFYFLIIIN